MRIECPKCGHITNQSEDELLKLNHTITCPDCMSLLKIVDGIAYIPTDKAPLEDLKPQEPPQFKGEQYYEDQRRLEYLDPLYSAAVDYVKTCDAITLPMLQRYFDITPERAETLMQQLEDNKVVAPFDGMHPRKILIEHDSRVTSNYWNRGRRYETEKQMKEQLEQLEQAQKENPDSMPRTRGCTCSLPGCGIVIFMLLLIYLLIQFFR